MALTSPGVEVNVIDESFYTPAAGATVPLIMVATAESKPNGSGTGTAQGTLKANAGKVYLMTSQRELTDTFGNPTFYTDTSNNPLHGNELNEYGLQAAYSYLGVANRAYVVRADVDLGKLTGSASAPTGDATDGTYWFDVDDTAYGVFEWDASTQKFTNKTITVITGSSDLDGVSGATYTGVKTSVGSKGDYAIVTWNTENQMWYKNSDNAWVKVGSTTNTGFGSLGSVNTFTSDCWATSWPVVQGTTLTNGTISGTPVMKINGTEVTYSSAHGGSDAQNMAASINAAGIDGIGAKATSTNRVEIYTDGSAGANTDSTKDGALKLEEVADPGNPGQTYGLVNTLGLTVGYKPGVTLQISKHSQVPTWKTGDTQTIDASTVSSARPTGSVWVKTTVPNLGANWVVKQWSDATDTWSQVNAPIYASREAANYALDATGGGANVAVGTLFVDSDYTNQRIENTGGDDFAKPLANFKIYRRQAVSPTVASGGTSPTVTNGHALIIAESVKGSATVSSEKTVTINGTDAAAVATAISGAGFTNIVASVTTDGRLQLTHSLGGEIYIRNSSAGTAIADLGFTTSRDNVYNAPTGGDFNGGIVISNWKPLSYQASTTAPTSTPADGTLWYSTTLDEVDIMVHNGTTWVGYQTYLPNTDPNGPIVSATEPTQQSDASALQNGDIWVDTGDTEKYGQNIYKYDGNTLEWVAIDVTDQTTEEGILFADARYGVSGATGDTAADIADYLTSDYLDPDAPDPDLYPRGMLLWNTRRSGFNVKKFVVGHVDVNANNGANIRFQGTGTTYNGGSDEPMSGYKVNRWIGFNTQAEDGSGLFGRHAQRKTVVSAIKSEIDTNQDMRDEETRNFTLLACPGYVECASNLVNLNIDRGITGFVVADTPMRLGSSATELLEYGNNSNNALADGETGVTTYDEYMGMFYPSGFTTDVNGNNIVVPPSYMMLRTIALSDAVSYPWFAPAGTRRGGITNASSVGFIDSEGEFKPVSLNEGVRDTMAGVKINPLTFITGSGLVNFGQYTRARNASALDRINVARLTAYLRRQLGLLAKPFMFEPNDKITRDEIKQACESLLLELVGQRALYDFLVVCDDSNNTPARIDRNELYVDIAIEPVKSVEFIYIPLRLKNTGEIASLGNQ